MDAHQISDISRHKCLIYEGHPSEQLPIVVPLLKGGIEENWKCLYLGAPEMLQMVDTALAAGGVDTSRAKKRGALVLSSDRSHLDGGVFNPQEMIDELCSTIDDAVREGFQGLCATGDMRWELGADENFDHLIEYEAKLELVFRERPLTGICQYHRDILPARAVRDALVTHRSAYIGDVLNRDNLFYVPPELLFDAASNSDASKQGEWMCQQILRVLAAERGRDRALDALRKSEAEQRHLAEQLAEMNRELERRVAERTAELQVANKHLEAFSYSVSHDLRAPLRAIASFSELIETDCAHKLGDEGRHHLSRVLANARRMSELIEGMLGLARVVKADVDRAAVDLTAVARDVVREIRDMNPGRHAEVVVHEGLRAVGDRTLLRAVLANLLENAWKFTSRCDVARIEVGRFGEEAGKPIFGVKDNGVGFDMKYQAKLFGVFQRLHHPEEFPGTGVGLATVERIVARHGGRIWAESSPNAGAAFFFTLPGE